MCILRYFYADRREATLSTAAKCERGGEERSLWANTKERCILLFNTGVWRREEIRETWRNSSGGAIQYETSEWSFQILHCRTRTTATTSRAVASTIQPVGVERVSRSKKDFEPNLSVFHVVPLRVGLFASSFKFTRFSSGGRCLFSLSRDSCCGCITQSPLPKQLQQHFLQPTRFLLLAY